MGESVIIYLIINKKVHAMPSNGNTKMKLLLLMDFLNNYSDEEHPISSGEL